ncbi:hypothetical protein ES703_65476 [subsurface metagenome]
MDRTQIIERALGLAQAVARFVARAREFFYEVVLSDRSCSRCGGSLAMEADGRCRCRSCGSVFDPTVVYQRCPGCGGRPRLRVRRYACASCGADVVSRFLFDGLVFDTEYFRQRMAESRRRRQEVRERVRQMLAEGRSEYLEPLPADLDSTPGLLAALNGLSDAATEQPLHELRSQFDLQRYEAHIQAHIRLIPLSLEEIPPLGEDGRSDRICRFMAIIFLAHAGLLTVWQDGEAVMVRKREANTEGQGVPGGSEKSDGVEELVGRVEA